MTQENLLARYSVLHELGRGATSAVYAARDRETGAVVALKRLDAGSGKSDPGQAAGFLKRARAARLLKHRNIVKVHDAGEVGGTVYIAMEMVEGQSLRALLDAGPIPIARAMQIVRDIASGLAHAHLEGVVHGAIKPSNVIVLRSGGVKITDFGVGQAGGLGTMSPEQLRGGPVDHRCDIFSLGALFYEMLTRRRPFEGGSPKEVTENIPRARPPLPSAVNEHVPRALDAVVLRMLAAEPAGRTPGAPILLRDLQRLEAALGLAGAQEPKASAPPETPKPPTPRPDANGLRDAAPMPAFDYQKAMAIMERESRPGRPSRSRPAAFAAAAVLVALGIGFAGFKYYDFSGWSERDIAASRPSEAPPTALAASRPAGPGPVAETTGEPAADAGAPEAVEDGQAQEGQAQRESLAAVSAPSPLPAPPPAAEPSADTEKSVIPAAEPLPAKAPAQPPDGTAQVIVAVSPRGEIYINGEHHGTTPPLATLYLEPGMHRIEVRSGSWKPYLTYMTVQAGDVRRIRHDFGARRGAGPPKSASLQNGSRRVR